MFPCESWMMPDHLIQSWQRRRELQQQITPRESVARILLPLPPLISRTPASSPRHLLSQFLLQFCTARNVSTPAGTEYKYNF